MSDYSVGDLIIFETGHYSDKTYDNPLRVIKAFNKAEVVDTFNIEWIPHRCEGGNKPEPDEFVGWLIVAGYLLPLDETVSKWHIGHSWEFDPS